MGEASELAAPATMDWQKARRVLRKLMAAVPLALVSASTEFRGAARGRLHGIHHGSAQGTAF